MRMRSISFLSLYYRKGELEIFPSPIAYVKVSVRVTPHYSLRWLLHQQAVFEEGETGIFPNFRAYMERESSKFDSLFGGRELKIFLIPIDFPHISWITLYIFHIFFHIFHIFLSKFQVPEHNMKEERMFEIRLFKLLLIVERTINNKIIIENNMHRS